MRRSDLPTPALTVDAAGFDANVVTMAGVRPGAALRPHVKAFKSTALAARLAQAGHRSFCCATIREVEGMAAAGLGEDLLLANEVLDASRLGPLVEAGARVTVAVDSPETIAAAAAGGVREVLVDVNVGLPRCGCDPADAGRLAELARSKGLSVRGVMGYEGHLMAVEDRMKQARQVEAAMAKLLVAHADVGGLISAGGTGTYDVNRWADEIQAGSYVLMDTHYGRLGLPFVQALFLDCTVISVNRGGGWVVVDGGLKALGMDHGDPAVVGEDLRVFFCSDEHTTVVGDIGDVSVGDRLRLVPAHIDPTIARHEQLWVVDRDDEVIDRWPVDLRHW
ncbi:MAG: alanine racemase [Actinomycetota bacterium]|nr:alanine racemase [Actinomycetota bacterium]